MTEVFLILFAGGVLLAAAIEDPNQVTLQWLRLAGIIALTLTGVAFFFLLARQPAAPDHRTQRLIAFTATAAAILGQLATVQVAGKKSQRLFAAIAFVLATCAGFIAVSDL